MFKQVIVLISAITTKICFGQETVVLTIPDGDVKGLVQTTTKNHHTYYQFIGIPYAEPPVGELRFALPVKNSPWAGIYDATYNRPQCIQYGIDDSNDVADILGLSKVLGAEDCLHMTVYTPKLNVSDLPVLVWFYGGAFIFGNCSYDFYGPDDFLEQGLVFVSFNYRLGIFGFLSTGDEACPGNWGLKDQILALKWVQENIAYFGGDPKKVTIFGQSAGAVSVHLMMQTNQTRGLYRGAIMNSGISLALWSLNTRAGEDSELLAINLKIDTKNNNTYLIELLRKVDAELLHRVGWTTVRTLQLGNGLRGLPWAPVMEPDVAGAVLTRPSCHALSQCYFNQVPVLMGANSNEAIATVNVSFLIKFLLIYHDVDVPSLTPYSMTKEIDKRFHAGSDIDHTFFGPELMALADDEKIANFLSTDQFDRPIRQAATLMSFCTTVYYYVFGYESASKPENSISGVGHAEELGYLFKLLNRVKTHETDIKVSQMLVKLWSNFVKHCDPTPHQDPALNNTIWYPVNATATNFTYMSLNESMVQAVNPKQKFWEYFRFLWLHYGTDDEDEMTTY